MDFDGISCGLISKFGWNEEKIASINFSAGKNTEKWQFLTSDTIMVHCSELVDPTKISLKPKL